MSRCTVVHMKGLVKLKLTYIGLTRGGPSQGVFVAALKAGKKR